MTGHATNHPPSGASVSTAVRQSISVPPGDVFPLCCPIEEYKWIPGWRCRLVHCPNEGIELGTVFREFFSAPFLLGRPWGETTWTAVLYEPQSHRVHFELENAHSSSRYEIEMVDDGRGGTVATLELTYRALDQSGDALARRGLPEKLEVMLELLGLMLKTYCETGRKVRPDVLKRAIVNDRRLRRLDKAHIAINRLAMRR